MAETKKASTAGAGEAAALPGATVYLHPTFNREPVGPQPSGPGRKPRGVFTMHLARARREHRLAGIEAERDSLSGRRAAIIQVRDFALGELQKLDELMARLPDPPTRGAACRRSRAAPTRTTAGGNA
jgi:hypothetical protein